MKYNVFFVMKASTALSQAMLVILHSQQVNVNDFHVTAI